MQFNANAILNSSIEEANSTRMEPMPIGEGYIGLVTKVDVKTGTNKKNEPWVRLELMVEVDGDPRLEAIGMTKKSIRIDGLLDITDKGTIDTSKGKNVQLGRLREATGLNQPGRAFSPLMFQGQMLKFDVSHDVNEEDPTIIYDRAKNIRAATAE
jgi:hypothetical protein